MVSTRTIARALLVAALFGLAAGSAAAFPIEPGPPPPPSPAPKPKPKPKKKTIVFPVLGSVEFTNDYGAPRPQGPHQGIDILAPRHAYALAAEAGRVRFYTGSGRAGCMLYLDGKSGTTYYYIHLNNDLGPGNDNRGGCKIGVTFPNGLKSGQRVTAGQLIGFVGDSGDANGIHPHLHFEVHPAKKVAVDPFPYLKAARHLLFAAPAGTPFTLELDGTVLMPSADTVQIRVGDVHAWPMRQHQRKLRRSVLLSVPTSAVVQATNGTTSRPALLVNAQKGQSVKIWTVPARATLRAARGDDLALNAALVLLKTAP
jgi:hypothetical protein